MKVYSSLLNTLAYSFSQTAVRRTFRLLVLLAGVFTAQMCPLGWTQATAETATAAPHTQASVHPVSQAGTQPGRALALTPGIINTVAGNGSMGYSGDGGAPVNAQVSFPNGVAFDTAGNVYIADTGNDCIRVINLQTNSIVVAGVTVQPGSIATIAGTGSLGFSGDNGPATAATLWTPTDVAIDSTGNIFISDTSNSRIRKISNSGTISTFAGTSSTGMSGDGGPAAQAQLYHPAGIALDAAGNLYIADVNNSRVRVVNRQSSAITIGGVTIQPGNLATIAGNGTAGFSGDNGPSTQAELNRPAGVAIDPLGYLYIADEYNNLVRKVVLATGTISTIAGVANPPGNGGFTGDGGQATQAKLSNPIGVTVDQAGNLYIADYNNNRVRRVNPANGIITTVAGGGSALFNGNGYGGDGGPALSALMSYPSGGAIDGLGNLYIADTANNRVREVNVQQSSLTFASVSVKGGVKGNHCGGVKGSQ